MPAWSVMDLGSLQAAEASRLGHLFSLGVGRSRLRGPHEYY